MEMDTGNNLNGLVRDITYSIHEVVEKNVAYAFSETYGKITMPMAPPKHIYDTLDTSVWNTIFEIRRPVFKHSYNGSWKINRG